MFNQVQTHFEKFNSFMDRIDKRLSSLESTAQSILKNQKTSNPDDLSGYIAKTELESLRKMQEQMETDFEVAKRMQADIDSKFQKEKQETEKKRSSTTTRKDTTPPPSSMQDCPICGSKVPFLELEFHVNQCLEGITSGDTKDLTPEKVSFWKRVFGPGPKKDDTANNQVVVRTTSTPAPKTIPLAKTQQPTPTPMPMYPGNGQDYYQMPLVYRGGGGYPQPQMMPPMYGGYPQQIYYYPTNMQQQPPNQTGKK